MARTAAVSDQPHVAHSGDLLGQGIVIYEWEFDDGTKGGPNAEAKVAEQQTAESSAQQLQQAGTVTSLRKDTQCKGIFDVRTLLFILSHCILTVLAATSMDKLILGQFS